MNCPGEQAGKLRRLSDMGQGTWWKELNSSHTHHHGYWVKTRARVHRVILFVNFIKKLKENTWNKTLDGLGMLICTVKLLRKTTKYKLPATCGRRKGEGRTKEWEGIDNSLLLKLVSTLAFIKLLFMYYLLNIFLCSLIEYICIYIYACMHIHSWLNIYFMWAKYLVINDNAIIKRYIWDEKLYLIYLWLSDTKHIFLLIVGIWKVVC